tara:strand:+ start:3819 stop:4187 length:369 start_codon:yes stop_codon:yes gene_type:complete
VNAVDRAGRGLLHCTVAGDYEGEGFDSAQDHDSEDLGEGSGVTGPGVNSDIDPQLEISSSLESGGVLRRRKLKLLLKDGNVPASLLNLNVRDGRGESALDLAVRLGRVGCARVLVETPGVET